MLFVKCGVCEDAFVAQWQSTGLVNQGSGVQSSPEALLFFSCFFFLIRIPYPFVFYFIF